MSSCPLSEMLDYLDDGSMPPLEWVVRVSRGGEVDPFRGAWEAAREAYAMWYIADVLGDAHFHDVSRRWINGATDAGMICDRCRINRFDICAACVALVHAKVDPATLPTLSEFVAKYREWISQ